MFSFLTLSVCQSGNKTYRIINIEQRHTVEYLGLHLHLDSNLKGESMAMKVLKRINEKFKVLYRQNKYLTPRLKRLLCNTLIHPHLDCLCTSSFSLFNNNL